MVNKDEYKTLTRRLCTGTTTTSTLNLDLVLSKARRLQRKFC